MKKFLASALLLIAVLVALVAHTSPVIVAGDPLTVNDTTATNTIALAFSFNPLLSQYTVQHGALASTNDIQVDIYANVTSNVVNAVKVGTWHPSNTNAATETIYANQFALTNYTFTTITTTNNQTGLYMTYGQ